MRDVTRRLVRLVLGVTTLLGVLAFGIGLVYGWDSGELMAFGVIAVVVELWLLGNVTSTWGWFARRVWFWWKR